MQKINEKLQPLLKTGIQAGKDAYESIKKKAKAVKEKVMSKVNQSHQVTTKMIEKLMNGFNVKSEDNGGINYRFFSNLNDFLKGRHNNFVSSAITGIYREFDKSMNPNDLVKSKRKQISLTQIGLMLCIITPLGVGLFFYAKELIIPILGIIGIVYIIFTFYY